VSERGLFIAIEGGDGSGKATQAKLLAKRASDEGYDVLTPSFPRYGNASARYSGRYLDGQYGDVHEVHPDLASLTYAYDRFAASAVIRQHLQRKNSLVVADRYVASNLAHQGTKINDAAKRHRFYDEILEMEYGVFGIPRPAQSFVLLVPTTVAQLNVDRKDAATRSYTEKKRDIHEANADHLELAKANYIELCQSFPGQFTPIECMQDEHTMRSREDIHTEIWNRVMELLRQPS
jgi:dTMP kinase